MLHLHPDLKVGVFLASFKFDSVVLFRLVSGIEPITLQCQVRGPYTLYLCAGDG